MHASGGTPTKQELVAELHELRARVAVLEQSEAILQAVVQGIPDPLYAKDERGRYTMVNPAAARLLGRGATQILGLDIQELMPPDSACQIAEVDTRVMAEGRLCSYVAEVNADGVTRT